MKKLKRILLGIMLSITLIPIALQNINAASANISLSMPNQVKVGESFSVTASYSGSEKILWEISISSNSGVSKSFEDYNNFEGRVSGSQSITTSISSPGTYTFYASTDGSMGYDSETYANAQTSRSITVVSSSTGGGDTGGGDTGGGDTDGGGGGGNYYPQEPSEPTPEEIAQKEKEEKEALQKVPLISTVEFISNSSAHSGIIINTIKPEEDKWSYDYTLPKRINKFILDVKGTSEDVVLTYDKEYEFAEGVTEAKTINIRAVKDDIIQEYTLKVSPDTSKPIEVNVADVSYRLFEDDLLSEYMKKQGFKVESFKNTADVAIPFYSMDKVKIQPLLDSENNASWYRMNDENQAIEKVSLLFDNDAKPLFVVEAPEEEKNQTIQTVSYKQKEYEIPEELTSIDTEIKWDNKYSSWDTQDGDVVQAMRSDSNPDKYRINPEKDVVVAVVSFDQINSSMYQWWAYISTGLLIAVSAAFIWFLNKNNKLNKSA